MARRMRRDLGKEALWRERLADQAASGLTITQWCRQSGHSHWLFHYWRRALAKRDGRRCKPVSGRAAESHEAKPPGAAFARVVIAPPISKSALSESAGEPVIEIVVSDSCRVRVGTGFDAPTLSRVLAVLEGRPC